MVAWLGALLVTPFLTSLSALNLV